MINTVLAICLVVALGAFVLWLISDRGPKNKLPQDVHPRQQIGAISNPEWLAGAHRAPEANPGGINKKIVPSYDTRKRIKTLLAAGRYGWDVTLVYFDESGNEHKVTLPPPDVRGVQRDKVNNIEINLADGTPIPLHRIKYIFVDAATEDARNRYRIGSALDDDYS